jgi:hypothetical protein
MLLPHTMFILPILLFVLCCLFRIHFPSIGQFPRTKTALAEVKDVVVCPLDRLVSE